MYAACMYVSVCTYVSVRVCVFVCVLVRMCGRDLPTLVASAPLLPPRHMPKRTAALPAYASRLSLMIPHDTYIYTDIHLYLYLLSSHVAAGAGELSLASPHHGLVPAVSTSWSPDPNDGTGFPFSDSRLTAVFAPRSFAELTQAAFTVSAAALSIFGGFINDMSGVRPVPVCSFVYN
jgi:hypothetical protein